MARPKSHTPQEEHEGGAVGNAELILQADAQLRCNTSDFLTHLRRALQKHNTLELTEASFEAAWQSLQSAGLVNSDYAQLESRRRPQFLAGIIDLHLSTDSRRFLTGLRKSNWQLDPVHALLVFGLTGLSNWRTLSALGALAKHQPDFPTAVRLLEEKQTQRRDGVVKRRGLSRTAEWATHDVECATRDLCPQPETCQYGCAVVQKRGRRKEQQEKQKGQEDTSKTGEQLDLETDTHSGEEHADEGQSELDTEADDGNRDDGSLDDDNLDEDDDENASCPEREYGRRHAGGDLSDDPTTFLYDDAAQRDTPSASPASTAPHIFHSDSPFNNNILDPDDTHPSTLLHARPEADDPADDDDDDDDDDDESSHVLQHCDGDNNTTAPAANNNEGIAAADSSIAHTIASNSNINAAVTGGIIRSVSVMAMPPPSKRRRTSAIDMGAWHDDSMDGWLELLRHPSHDDETTLDSLPVLHNLCTLDAGVRGTFACFMHGTPDDTTSQYFTLLDLESTTVYSTSDAAVSEALQFAKKHFPDLTFDEEKYTPLLSLDDDKDNAFLYAFWACEAAVGRDLSETPGMLPLCKAVIRAGSEYVLNPTMSDDIMRWLADELGMIAHSESEPHDTAVSAVDLSGIHPSLRALFDGPLAYAHRTTQALERQPHLDRCIQSAKYMRNLLDLRARGNGEAFQQLMQQLDANTRALQGNKRFKAKRTMDKFKKVASEHRHALERLCQVIANAVVEWESESEGIAAMLQAEKKKLRDAFTVSAELLDK